jgi:hypothetical protein
MCMHNMLFPCFCADHFLTCNLFCNTNVMFFVAPWEKNRLAELANSELRLSVWTDDVYSFMRSQKRRRIQSSDISQDFDAMR